MQQQTMKIDCGTKYPRLSNLFREFSDLVPPNQIDFSKNTLDELRRFRSQHINKGFTWNDFNIAVESNIENSFPDVLKHLKSLHSIAKEIAGGDQSKRFIDEAALYLLHIFWDEDQCLNRHITLLRQMFGTVSSSTASNAFTLVFKIRAVLSDDCIDELRMKLSSRQNRSQAHRRFGSKISYNGISVWQEPDVSFLRDLSTGLDALHTFSMKYDGINAVSVTKEDKKPPSKKFGRSWLMNEIKSFETSQGDISTGDLCDTIFQLLTSERSNDDLQNEMFDLLGFDRFQLIQIILDHRKDIVANSATEEKKSNVTAATEQRRPMFGCQVLIQSEQEKQQMKQAWKEEKKLSRLAGKDENTDEDELDFDLMELRAKRHAALKAPVQTTPKPRSVQSQDVYPNVYDSFSKAKQTSGFISGLKMMLPENVRRIDTKVYEEVNIPMADSAPTSVGSNLVPVSSLDDIGQIAFQGVKNLNRIQSVVFDTAYHSNENLLICAPTGAGKTNIALLTVVHCLRQHMNQGVTQKDKFKMVYVAPLKALPAEMTSSFSKKLSPLGVTVRELTGDMKLTKSEILNTQMLVTTPEKWDVVTRKGTGDVALTNLVKLLIIDEVHLLHGDRGPVVEAIVARTLRQVETSQSMIRIVGLSATLPNYLDVARFLRVNPYVGLFYFDSRFRPVPLEQTFIGIKAIKPLQQMTDMDSVCYDKVYEMVAKGHQVMVFVHARNSTVRTALVLRELAQQRGQLKVFEPESSSAVGLAQKAFAKSRSKQLPELFQCGFSVHHAGLLRTDRNLVEKYFGEGLIKVLVCTSTLAWGVNLPAHAVIIKGTEIYDAKHGSFVNLGILDVLQIFGRAGRPQFDKSGHGTILTTHDKLSHYLSLLTNQFPIESNFITCLADNLNAEVALGTISNVDEGVQWLSYSYLFVRVRLNPQVYGINYNNVQEDPMLERWRRENITIAARKLDKAKMIRFTERTGDLSITDLGRTASHYYIKYDTVECFNIEMQNIMNERDILAMVSKAQEFDQLKIREEEQDELESLLEEHCRVHVLGGTTEIFGKVNTLLQTFLSRGRVNSFSLVSDLSFITQNAVRIARAVFEIMLHRNNPLMAGRFLRLCLMLEHQQWDTDSEMRHFHILGPDIINKIEGCSGLNVHKLREMDSKEIGTIIRHAKMGEVVKRCAYEFPLLEMESSLHPITRTVLRIRLTITPDFRWNDSVHGRTSEAFWIWVEDPDNNYMYHSEYFLLTKKQVITKEPQELVMTIPLTEPLPAQYLIRASSDHWLGSNTTLALSFQNLILPETHPPHTDLLELQPLPVTALGDTQLELLYPFTHFNPIQTQIFHCLYHTDNNVLLGAPTGSGKTIAAEIAMFRVFKQYPGTKVVYIAPLKALVRERIEDWKIRLQQKLNRRVVELTGDVTPDVHAISVADVIVTTPEKWDGISRSWQTRGYVRAVSLIIIDEIHLLGEDRGPVLEVIVSRTNFISSHTSHTLRIIGLSTALANAKDLANWLGIGQMGLYNFRPSVRPVPLEVHIHGFPGKHYCPRMATMNKPTFQAIRLYSPAKPTLIFVSSRRQTRLTALDLIAYLAAEDDPKQWLHMDEVEMDQIVGGVKDTNLKLTLAFGIGMHHAGLQERDRKTVEELFVNQKIQILIATATLAWGVNFPAHLVVIKGTEYYDGKVRRYVDMPITDVLQMMGRAGRPQFDNQGVAVVLVHDMKKNFYKKFLYEPFPVESSLLAVMADHMNAEIVAGTIKTRQDALDYVTWTYFFRRLLRNPTYYGLETLENKDINWFLSNLIEKSLNILEEARCVVLHDDGRSVSPTSMGRIASYYYLSHETMLHLQKTLGPEMDMEKVLNALCHVHEYSQIPVRHNEDILNGELAKLCPIQVDSLSMDSPHIKALLLLQAHFSHLHLPCSDYYTDLKSVLDQSIRILQAMIDVSAENGWLATTLRLQLLMQMVLQACWLKDSPLITLPYIEPHYLYLFRTRKEYSTLPGLMNISYSELANILRMELDEGQIEQVHKVLASLPVIQIELSISGCLPDDETEKPIKTKDISSCPITVYSNTEYTLCVKLTRLNRETEKRAHTPFFPKSKTDGWFLTLGHIDSVDLLAVKRVPTVRQKSNQRLTFFIPKKTGRIMLTVYLISDTYLGLDQQYNLLFDVITCKTVENKGDEN